MRPSRPSSSASRSSLSPALPALRLISSPVLFDIEGRGDRTTRAYLRTRFVRFLVSLRKSTQDATASMYYASCPDCRWTESGQTRSSTSEYGLTEDEIAFIESQVAEHDSELFDEVERTKRR